MITYKTDSEIKLMQQGGEILQGAIAAMLDFISVGVTTREVDKVATDYILTRGATPSFQKVPGYHDTICICINSQVVHTPPSEQVIKDGDVVTIDCGVLYGGFNTDSATTIQIGKTDLATQKFLKIGQETLRIAITQVRQGNRIGQISKAIDSELSREGLHAIVELTGHGVGKELHEDPPIPGVAPKSVLDTPIIKSGMTLAVEVIYSKGTDKVVLEKGSDWSLITADQSLSACFESTVAVMKNKTAILA